jgi:hypothetical protein
MTGENGLFSKRFERVGVLVTLALPVSNDAAVRNVGCSTSVDSCGKETDLPNSLDPEVYIPDTSDPKYDSLPCPLKTLPLSPSGEYKLVADPRCT